MNYYTLAHCIKVEELKRFTLDVSIDPQAQLIETFKILSNEYGYECLINPECRYGNVAGWHSHFPRELCLITDGIEPRRQLKAVCHEKAHCVQSRATEGLFGYRHHGEVARDWDEYYIYERRADELGWHIAILYFPWIIANMPSPYWECNISGMEIKVPVNGLNHDDFKTYKTDGGVIALYKKWAEKKRSIGELK